MGIKLLDGTGLQYVFSKIKSALANKQDKLTLPLSVANGGTGNSSGTSSSVATTEDNVNNLFLVGVTSGATATLKRDTSIVVKGNTITGNLSGNVTGNVTGSSGSTTGNAATATKLKTGRTLKVDLASTGVSTSFDGSSNISDIGVNGVLKEANGGTGKSNILEVRVGSADKLSNASTIGGITQPVYFTNGLPYAISGTVGGPTTPVYLSQGVITACSSKIGSTTNPVYFSSGTIASCTYELKSTVNGGTANKLAYYSGNNAVSSYTGSKGASNKICYLNNGVPTDGITIGYGDSLPSSGSAGDIYILI